MPIRAQRLRVDYREAPGTGYWRSERSLPADSPDARDGKTGDVVCNPVNPVREKEFRFH